MLCLGGCGLLGEAWSAQALSSVQAAQQLCCSAINGFRKPKGRMQKLSLHYTGRTGWNQHWCGAQPRLSTAWGGA